MTTTTQIAGEAMTDEWRTAFDDRHEFDVYPEHFMSGLRNEFAAGWHAAMKSQARALLASKPACPVPLTDDQLELMASQSGLYGVRKAAVAYAREVIAASTAPAQSCGDAEQADEAVTVTPAMVKAAMPWLTGLQHMRKTDKESHVEEAIRAAFTARAKDSK
jgi:hypothetical protein